MLDLAAVMPWVGAALSIIALLTQLKNILSSGEKQLDTRLTKVENKAIEHDRRIQTVENDMRHLPDRESQHRLELALEKVNGRLDTLNETLKPIKANGEAMNELLLERARKANE